MITMRLIIIWVIMRKDTQKISLLAMTVRRNRPSEGIALQIKFNESGIISYVDWNN